MIHSEQIDQIATALAKAQGVMEAAAKDASNPFFKSNYADLASVWDACRGPLSDNGLCIIQDPSSSGNIVSVETTLAHSSGQWMRGLLSAEAKDASPQSIGSTITYLRRYQLQSFAGVAPEEDDGEAGQGRGVVEARPGKRKPEATAKNGASLANPPKQADVVAPAALEQAKRDVRAIYDAAKLAGLTSPETLAPVLFNICGVRKAVDVPRAEVKNVLDALAAMPQPVHPV